MGLFVNLGALLSGKGTTYHGSTRSKAFQEVLESGTNEETYIGDLLRKYTGSALTTAEQQANAFTAQREDIAWQREMDAANTAYQRQVADMQAAGLNPMLAASGSGGSVVPSASASGSVSPSGASLNLGSILSAITGIGVANKEKQLMDAQINKLNADADNTRADTEGKNLQNTFFKNVQKYREEGERLSNEVTRGQYRQYEQNIKESNQRIEQMIAQTKSEEEKAALFVQQRIQSVAEVDNMVAMRPFLQAELSARTSREKADARLAAVNEAYTKGLIDSGAISAAVRLDNAKASDAEIDALSKEFAQALKDGTLIKAARDNGDWKSSVVIGLYQGLNNAVKSVLGKW